MESFITFIHRFQPWRNRGWFGIVFPLYFLALVKLRPNYRIVPRCDSLECSVLPNQHLVKPFLVLAKAKTWRMRYKMTVNFNMTLIAFFRQFLHDGSCSWPRWSDWSYCNGRFIWLWCGQYPIYLPFLFLEVGDCIFFGIFYESVLSTDMYGCRTVGESHIRLLERRLEQGIEMLAAKKKR